MTHPPSRPPSAPALPASAPLVQPTVNVTPQEEPREFVFTLAEAKAYAAGINLRSALRRYSPQEEKFET